LVYRRLREALGGQVTAVICGGAALAPEIGQRFDGIGIPVLEGFGATETAPIVSGGPFAPLHHGTVGRPYPGTTVRLAEDGEILVRGPQVFRGYRGDPDATAAALRDGWYHTGDLGALTAAGHLRIVGRKKDILITAGGKNVVPGPLEDRIRAHPLVEECVVLGERRPYVTALVWLDPVEAGRLLDEHGLPTPSPAPNGHAPPTGGLTPAAEQLLRSQLDDAIADANRTVSRAESIGRYAIADEPLSIAAGSLTPTTKVRRAVVLERFADHIERLYAAH
jgi:long-chain acyl-CoA synthetase